MEEFDALAIHDRLCQDAICVTRREALKKLSGWALKHYDAGSGCVEITDTFTNEDIGLARTLLAKHNEEDNGTDSVWYLTPITLTMPEQQPHNT